MLSQLGQARYRLGIAMVDRFDELGFERVGYAARLVISAAGL